MGSLNINEKFESVIPALQLLINLGYEYLTPSEAFNERQQKFSNVILEEVLRTQLKEINQIEYKNNKYLFSEENVQSAIQTIKNIRYEGLQKINEAIYDLLTLGISLEQSIEGSLKSFTLKYIDWKNPRNNKFHVTTEFNVVRQASNEKIRPDLVLFVNGIPFAVIECKSPTEELSQGISQMIRNQGDDYIPKLFTYSQLLLATNKNAAKYATAGTPAKFWFQWHENIADQTIQAYFKDELPMKAKAALFDQMWAGDFKEYYPFHTLITEQDRTIYALCRPERLLELTLLYTIFDDGVKKIARYQQYFSIKKTLARVKQFDYDNKRQSGIIWHTQGSGKSLIMVMLARALAMNTEIADPRIVLVNDRVDLDEQLSKTFAACGRHPVTAQTGRHLLELISEKKPGIITTLVHKFDKALKVKTFQDNSTDIFLLVDESHRTQFGSFAAKMRQMFPRACYLGFTGTPLVKREKNSFTKFGGIIDTYTIDQAVKDGAVVPLLYEGRHVEQEVNQKAIDTWFERICAGLTDEQKADLKRKYSRAGMLNKTEQTIYCHAFDISEHYRQNFQGTGLKAQLVAPRKLEALKYHQFLQEIGYASSAVIISPPDEREGYDDPEVETNSEFNQFWQKMMKQYGSEKNYNKQIINCFNSDGNPEILIVVDKLLTGFDSPRNTVLYLTRPLREHTLLQAIARVNRLFENEDERKSKDFGYIIDYANVLGELDNALTTYHALADFDEEELRGTVTSIQEEIKKLPQHHSDVWDLFKSIKNSKESEAYERLLADEKIRQEFYARLTLFAKTLAIALSSTQFIITTASEKITLYKDDLKNLQKLRTIVKQRYFEIVDYKDYEPKIQKLLDTHISANEVIQLNVPINIFDDLAFEQIKSDKNKTDAAKADIIAHATKKIISECMDKDPAFYEKFSKLIQKTIDDFREQRIHDLQYLKSACEIRDAVIHRNTNDVPDSIRNNSDAIAFFGLLKEYLTKHIVTEKKLIDTAAMIALEFIAILTKHNKINFWYDQTAQNNVKNDMDDYLCDKISVKFEVPLISEEVNELIEECMRLASHRM